MSEQIWVDILRLVECGRLSLFANSAGPHRDVATSRIPVSRPIPGRETAEIGELVNARE